MIRHSHQADQVEVKHKQNTMANGATLLNVIVDHLPKKDFVNEYIANKPSDYLEFYHVSLLYHLNLKFDHQLSCAIGSSVNRSKHDRPADLKK